MKNKPSFLHKFSYLLAIGIGSKCGYTIGFLYGGVLLGILLGIAGALIGSSLVGYIAIKVFNYKVDEVYLSLNKIKNDKNTNREKFSSTRTFFLLMIGVIVLVNILNIPKSDSTKKETVDNSHEVINFDSVDSLQNSKETKPSTYADLFKTEETKSSIEVNPFAKFELDGEWIFYTVSLGADHFYNKSSIKRNGNKVKVWIYVNFSPNDEEAKSLDIGSVRKLEEIDCVNETHKRLASHVFPKPYLKGKMTDDTQPNPRIEYIVPDSIGAILMKLVCKK